LEGAEIGQRNGLAGLRGIGPLRSKTNAVVRGEIEALQQSWRQWLRFSEA